MSYLVSFQIRFASVLGILNAFQIRWSKATIGLSSLPQPKKLVWLLVSMRLNFILILFHWFKVRQLGITNWIVDDDSDSEFKIRCPLYDDSDSDDKFELQFLVKSQFFCDLVYNFIPSQFNCRCLVWWRFIEYQIVGHELMCWICLHKPWWLK